MIQSRLHLSHGMRKKGSGECVFILVENGVALWFLFNFPLLFLLSPGLSAWPIFNLLVLS